jgi:hypothetical protein
MLGPTAKSSLFKKDWFTLSIDDAVLQFASTLQHTVIYSCSSTGNNRLNLVETVYKPFELTGTTKGNGND